MKILVVGSGGREHAITWSIQRTSQVATKIFCAPGNAGIQTNANIVPIAIDHPDHLVSFARSEGINLTFVGPEAPLAVGVVDQFEAAGLRIVGPSMKASRLEASKVFAKEFMARHNIPTAVFKVADSAGAAYEFLDDGSFGTPDSAVVVKADGLAAGKGVIVATSHAEAKHAIEQLMIQHAVGKHAAERVVLEEAMSGPEVSVLLFADGRDYVLMPPARDHKRIGENDTGPNTGGMGSITDPALLSSSQLDEIVQKIVEPTLAGARTEGFPFKGVLFLGLMLTDEGPKLLEYNVRFGDPETQAILVRLKTDLLSIFESIHTGSLGSMDVEWRPGASACVVLASEGYPGKYQNGLVIQGLDCFDSESVQIFHAGTALSADGKFVTAGGRVLGVTAACDTLKDSLSTCYSAISEISWPGMQFRRDIGASVVSQSR